jgi:hypothetical protein
VPSLGRQILDVSVQCLGDPKPVQREQRDQRTVAEITEAGLDEEGAEFVAVQAQGA